VIRLFEVDPSIPRCPACGEPRNAHPGTHFFPVKTPDHQGVDVFKSREWSGEAWSLAEIEKFNKRAAAHGWEPWKWPREWGEPPTRPEHWRRVRGVGRDLYFSVRMEQLFKRAKVMGILRAAGFEEKPTATDLEWVDEKLRLLASEGLAEQTAAAPAADAAKWLARYLKRNARRKPAAFDFEAVEAKHGVALPADYKAFITAVGPRSFDDVDGNEGFTARVLPPGKIDFKGYRAGKVPDLDEESARVDGVMFAATDHGDCFVFDVSPGGKAVGKTNPASNAKPAAGADAADYAVFRYDHEQNVMEPYAADFATCVRRFAKG